MTSLRGVIVVVADLAFLIGLSGGFNNNPKIYIDVDCISVIDPLLTGFNIILPDELIERHLSPHNTPLLYASAIPLHSGGEKPLRTLFYTDQIQDRLIRLDGLREKTWYFVCVEFENMHRRHRQGNTSSSCELSRTLDPFGKTASSLLRQVQQYSVGEFSLGFELTSEANFPVRFDTYLSDGSGRLQSYIVSEPKTLNVNFDNLVPAFNYGRLCVREVPLLGAYTAMGRAVQAELMQCYFSDLRTKDISNSVSAEPVHRAYRTAAAASSTTATLLSARLLLPHLLLTSFTVLALNL